MAAGHPRLNGPADASRIPLRLIVACLAALCVAPTSAAQPRPLSLDDLEDGGARWTANDSVADETGAQPRLCSIAPVSDAAPGAEGRHCAEIRFQPAAPGWASLSIPVDGPEVARRGLAQVAFWAKPTEGAARVRLVFRALYDNPATGRRDLDVSYVAEVTLDSPGWRLVTLPFERFRTEFGKPLGDSDIPHITLLQFAQMPVVAQAAFLVDDLALEPAGYVRRKPTPQRRPQPKPPPVSPPPAPATLSLPDTLSFDVNFGYTGPPLLLQMGVTLPDDVSALLESEGVASRFADAVRELAPCVVRVKISSFFRTPSETATGAAQSVDADRLTRALRWAVTAGARPLLCIDRPPAEASPEALAEFCRRLAGSLRGRPESPYYEVWDEPIFREQFPSVVEATQAYSTLAQAIKRADPDAKVGGIGFAAAWADQLTYFVANAQPLDFLSLHFYGAHTTSTSDGSLFAAATAGRAADLPSQLSFQQIRRLLRETRKSHAELYLTEVNINSARDREGRPRDPRTHTPFAAAWLAALAASASPYVDKLLWRSLYGKGWGLLDETGEPTFSWLAARTMDVYAPRGGGLCRL
ncbi:MAG: hypothetical protein ACE5O2_11000, partial [Armatimonadota bacterium]